MNSIVHRSYKKSRVILWDRNRLFLFTEQMLADPPDDKDDDRDDGNHLCELNEDDPDNNSSHMAHITVCALASLLA